MDNSSDPDTAVTQARELIEAEGADILIGNVSSSAALATIPVAEENDVIYIAEPAAAPAITAENFSPNTFRTSRTSYPGRPGHGLTVCWAWARRSSRSPRTTPSASARLAPSTPSSPAAAASSSNDTAEGCGTIYAPIETTDFTSYINQILDSGADVLIVSWAGAGFAPMFQQMSQLGVFDEMTVGTGVGDNQTLAAGYADALGVVGIQVYHYTLPNNEINDWLVERHMEEHGTPPDLWASGGMMAAIMAVEGLEATNGDSSAEALRTVYEDNFSFEGPKGTTTIRASDHVALQTLYFVRVVSVTDAEFRFVELVEEFGPEGPSRRVIWLTRTPTAARVNSE
jgi:branched-chain amino acid transport system substrate-binding protein